MPQHEQVIDEFNDALLSCRKWVKEAEVELARASRTAEVKRRVADRMAHKLEEALKTQKPQATLKENQKILKFQGLYEDAKDERLLAVIEEKEAEIYLLKAQLEASDMQKDMYLVEWGHACEHMDD